jgi:hypothetical protein
MIHKHLADRHLQTNRYLLWLDEKEGIVTFPLWNLSEQLVGYQQYNPSKPKLRLNDEMEGRYFSHITKPMLAVWGLESLDYRRDILFITEGIFDACRLHNRELPAVAVLANNPTKLRSWLSSLGRKIIVVSDNDAAGQKLNNFGDIVLITPGKDLGECSEEDIDKLLINI